MKTRSKTITIHINLPLKTLLRENVPNPEPIDGGEFEDEEMFLCEECFGFGYVGTEEKPEDCEACDGHGLIFEELEELMYDSDSDDPDWIPAIDELSDTDISLDDLTDYESDGSDCGSACNDKVCFCGTV
tara:strand:+ start:79 stop:468 length:390 start_codon:yes stop_codon:yes gene_type:complete